MTLLYRVLKSVIRNDKFALDPPEIYNGRVFALAAAVSGYHSNDGDFIS